jgi:hypothetical protein
VKDEQSDLRAEGFLSKFYLVVMTVTFSLTTPPWHALVVSGDISGAPAVTHWTTRTAAGAASVVTSGLLLDELAHLE